MKPLIYFFGSLPEGFSSFPSDETKEMFRDFLRKSKNTAQIVVHRKDNLLYYGYTRMMDKGKFFGICACYDSIFLNAGALFKEFDRIYAKMIQNGDVLKITESAIVEWNIDKFPEEKVVLTEYRILLSDKLSKLKTIELPPEDFSIIKDSCIDTSIEDGEAIITNALKRYHNVYIANYRYEVEKVTCFRNTINTLGIRLRESKQEINELKVQLRKTKAKQRNLVWVSVLGVVTLISGFVIWNKVLFPTEVTNYQTKDFTYYGPLKDGKPNGIGVAIYPDNDKYERRYYVGKFEDGVEKDSSSFVLYTGGDFFYGKTEGNKRDGVFFSKNDKFHVEGTLLNDETYNGIEFAHIEGTTYNHKQTKIFINGK